jgi:Lrp/AsnC family leucine-responsive transcriptional regulator
MDDMDRRIIAALVANGRLTHEQIARDVHLSRPAVFERIRRLEAKGVIRGYGARINWDAMGMPLTAFVWIRIANVACVDSGRRIADLRAEGAVLESLYRVTGDWCMFAKYRVASPAVLEQVIDLIRQSPGVVNTMTTIALSSQLEAIGSEVPAGLPAAAAS